MTSCGIFQAQGPGDFRDGGGLRWGWEALKMSHFTATYFFPHPPPCIRKLRPRKGHYLPKVPSGFFSYPRKPRSPNSVTQKWKTQLLANKEARATTEGKGSHPQQEDQSGFCEGGSHSGISQPPHTQLLGPRAILVFRVSQAHLLAL